MRRSRSNEPLEQRTASTQSPGDPHPSEFHLGSVIDAIPRFAWSTLPDGSVEFCNQRWLDYTGMSLDEARREELATSIHPQDKCDFVEKWRAALAEGESFEAEARIGRADGSYRWFLIRAEPLREANGGISRWCGSNIDITDLKRAEQERERLRQVQAELARVNRVTTMGELTASLAHEVNQPIAAAVTSANSCLHWLAAEVPNLDKARAAAERIVKDGTRAAEIISRTRLLFQKAAPQWQLADVSEVIAEMIILLRVEAT